MVLVLAAGVLTSCTGGGSSDSAASATASSERIGSGDDPNEVPASSTELGLEAARALLDRVSSAAVNEELLAELDDHRGDVSVLAAAWEQLDRGSERWVDVYVWANNGIDPTPLRRFVSHEDVELRYMASAGLVAMGDKSGFGPLIEALTDDSLVGSLQIPLWRVAVTALTRVAPSAQFGPVYGASMSQRESSQAEWRSWLESITDRSFDTETGLWRAP